MVIVLTTQLYNESKINKLALAPILGCKPEIYEWLTLARGEREQKVCGLKHNNSFLNYYYLCINNDFMVIKVNTKTTKEELTNLLANSYKKSNIRQHFGKLKGVFGDGLAYQKSLRKGDE